MVRPQAVADGCLLGAEVEQRETQLLHAGAVEEVVEWLGIRLGQELVAALEPDARALRLGEQARQLGDPLPDDLGLVVDRDTRVLGSESTQCSLGALDLLLRLAQLLAEEGLRGHVGHEARFLVGLHVGLRVGRGEEGGEGRVRRREAHLDEVRVAHVPHRDVAYVAVEEAGLGLGGSAAVGILVSGRWRSPPAARPEQAQYPAAHREEPRAARARLQERLVLRQPVAADHALRQVAALQHGHLRAEEARRAIHVPVVLVDAEDVLLELELDGRLARHLETGGCRVGARREQRDEDREPQRQPEARAGQPAILVDDAEVVAEMPRRGLAELRVEHLGQRGTSLRGRRRASGSLRLRSGNQLVSRHGFLLI